MDKNIVALVREDTKTVRVKFFPDIKVVNNGGSIAAVDDYDRYARQTAGKEYLYVTTLTCKPGDLAIVLVGERPAIVEIQSVDPTLAIQPNESRKYSWLVSVVDTSYYEALTSQNGKMEQILANAYQSTVRRQFRQVFLESTDGNTLKLLDEVLGNGTV